MKWRILSVLPDQNQMEQVKDLLEKDLSDLSFDFTTNETRARDKLKSGSYDLLVTSLDIPLDGGSLPEEGLCRGLGLAEWMEGENRDMKTILLTIAEDRNVNERVDRLKNCELVQQRLGWEDLFLKRARQGLEGIKVPEQKRLNVDIFLNLEKKTGAYSFLGVGFDCNLPNQPLDILPTEFVALLSESKALDENFRGEGEWQSKLQHIGQKLMEHIFERNADFGQLFWILVTTAGGLCNTRIRFVVEKEVHPIALEAIYGRHELVEKDYWMLHAPIYRTVGKAGGWGRPLFHDEETRGGPLNILIIESPTEGECDLGGGKTIPLGRLLNVKPECGFLKNYRLSPEYSGRVKIGQVEVIPRPSDGRPFVQQVRETLEGGNRAWHIVHYSGHSFFDPDTMKGYVFFPGGQDERGEPLIKAVDLEILSVWLRRAKPNLVFLSSCHSSEAGFVFTLASKQIPAIIGFRWDVKDDKAAEYTRVFYRLLFGGETRTLDDVFLKSRQQIHSEHRNNPIWAAPILVMQIPPP